MVDKRPFENVRREGSSFLLPRRKWRELLFIGAVVPYGSYGPQGPQGDLYIRDPSRPMPAFRDLDLIPEGVLFRVLAAEDDHVRLERVD